MSYPGSKGQAGVFQRIIGQMPPHEIYVELFYGGGYIARIKRWAEFNNAIDKSKAALKDVAKFFLPVNMCAMQWLETVLLGTPNDNRRTLIYADPPYLLSTRQGRLYYDYEMTDADHVRLLALLSACDCNVLLSGYPSTLYSDALKDWRCISYRTRTRGRTVTECLWANFPEPAELHDWRFAGKDRRERLTLKRLAARYLARLENMAPRKRGYVLNAIRERHA